MGYLFAGVFHTDPHHGAPHSGATRPGPRPAPHSGSRHQPPSSSFSKKNSQVRRDLSLHQPPSHEPATSPMPLRGRRRRSRRARPVESSERRRPPEDPEGVRRARRRRARGGLRRARFTGPSVRPRYGPWKILKISSEKF